MTDRGYMLGLRLAGEPAPNLPLLREGGLLCPIAGLNTLRPSSPPPSTSRPRPKSSAAR